MKDGGELTSRLQGLAMIAAVVWVFAPVLRGDWLWDDDKYIVHNGLMRDPAGFWKAWLQADGLGDYDPLTSMTRWLQWQSWGDDTLGYHLTNVGLHLAVALLLWRLFHRLGLAWGWLGALVFAVHPVTVESVAWIAELKNTLSLPPLLLAMLAFLDYDQGGGRRADYFRALAWFVVAMLAKTSGMMLPVIFLGYAWCKRGTIGREEMKASMPFFIVALAAGCLSVLPHYHPVADAEIYATGGGTARLASLGWAGLFLLGNAVFPFGLLPAYPDHAVEMPAAGDILPWFLLGSALWFFWSRRATWGLPVLAGLGFFLVNLVPVFGFIAVNYATMVWSMDHLLYLPMIGLIGLFAAGVEAAMKRLPPAARSPATAAVTLFVALAAWDSHRYAAAFSDEETLWRYTVERSPGFGLAQENLGKALLLRDQPGEARAHFEEALRWKPQRASSHYNLGKALVQMGRIEDGIAEYRIALGIDPADAEVENNLGVALVQAGKSAEAVEHFTRAVRLKPDYGLAYDNRGGALALTGRMREAVDNFTQALALLPDSAQVRDNLGGALLKLGRKEEAEKEFQQALQIQPDDRKALEGLAALPQAEAQRSVPGPP